MSAIPQPDGPDIDTGARGLQISWTLYSIAAVVVLLRLYAQGRILRQLGWGDALMVLSWIFGGVSCICSTVAYQHGFGRHFFYLNPSERVSAQKAIYISEPFTVLGSATGRLAFMVLMYRIFGTTRYRRWFIIFLMAQTVVVNIFTTVSIFTQCPNMTLWNPGGVLGVCWSPEVQEGIGLFQSSCNSATDFVLTVMPGYVFWGLQMGAKTKFGLICLMCLSIFAFVASIIKAVLLSSLGDRSDYTFNTVPFLTWISVENSLVIIAASVPMTRPIFVQADSRTPTYELHSRNHVHSHNHSHSRGSRGYALSSNPRVADLNSSSAENILPMQKQTANQTILKRTDYMVTYDEETGGELQQPAWARLKSSAMECHTVPS